MSSSLPRQFQLTNQSGLPPNIEARRIATQVAGQYNNNLSFQSCFNQRPQVPCSTSDDCRRWVVENCAEQDEFDTSAVCDVSSGTCVFER